MLRSYFTTALRALKRNWSYSVINVLGLTLSLACCLLLFLAIRYELSFDRHNAHADQTYRLISANKKANTDRQNAGIPLPALAALRNDFPNLKHQVTMVNRITNVVVTVGGKANQTTKK